MPLRWQLFPTPADTRRRLAFAVIAAAIVAGCSSPAPVRTPVHTAVRRQDPFAQFAPLTKRLVDEHKAGQPTMLARADAESFVRAFMVETKLLPPGPSRVECPAELDLSGSKHGVCRLHVAGVSIPYELWINDESRQIRARGDGAAIQTTRISDTVAHALQQKFPQMEFSPYDVQCGDNLVTIIHVGSRIRCVFTAEGDLYFLDVRFISLQGRVQVTVVR